MKSGERGDIIHLSTAMPGWVSVFDDGEYYARVIAWVIYVTDDGHRAMSSVSEGRDPVLEPDAKLVNFSYNKYDMALWEV